LGFTDKQYHVQLGVPLSLAKEATLEESKVARLDATVQFH